ncbi:MAG: hypothetical protein SVV80_06960 [Planctomycetota bacterium]|nr:hypothetical protein [Planctomycetota bacterium]
MAVLSRLLKAGSMTESLGVYIPATVFQRFLGLGRMLLFVYLLKETGYGLWGLGVVIFTMASSLVTLGSHHGLVRYVSFYEARGQLQAFYSRIRFLILTCAVALTAAALAGSDIMVALTRSKVAEVEPQRQLHLCWAALVNAGLLGLYHNMLGFLVGMRRYRAVSVLEIAFAVCFTILGVGVLLATADPMCLMIAHFISVLVVFVAGMLLLHTAIKSPEPLVGADKPTERPEETLIPEPDSDAVGLDAAMPFPVRQARAAEPSGLEGCFARVLRFGFVATIAGFLWQGAGYVSFLLTSRRYGEAKAGIFFAFLPVGQSLMALSNAARAVIFTHVARHWESGERRLAVSLLETTYKALVLGAMTIAVVLYVTSQWWVKILPSGFRGGLGLLGGLLLFFQASIHLALLNTLARLHERPTVVAIGPLLGGALIVPLAILWMDRYGPEGAALAAGVGMYAGMMAVSLVYLLIVRVRMQINTYFLMAVPAVLLLSKLTLGLVWIAVLIVTIFTTWLLDARQKRILSSSGRRILKQLRTAGSRRPPSR